jgi:hypothetical protein
MELFTVEKLPFPHKLVNSELISALYSRAVATRLLLDRFPAYIAAVLALVIFGFAPGFIALRAATRHP